MRAEVKNMVHTLTTLVKYVTWHLIISLNFTSFIGKI